MLKGKSFEILVASLPDHNAVVGEIYFDGKFVALVSQERGPGVFDLETPGAGIVEKEITRQVDLEGFKRALDFARKRLLGEES